MTKKDEQPKPKKEKKEVQPTEEEVQEFMRWFRKSHR